MWRLSGNERALTGGKIEFVRQIDLTFFTVVRLKKVDCFAKNLGQISAIYLVDMQ